MSVSIYWSLVDSSSAALEDPQEFLSPTECQRLSNLRFPKRREEWLLGRYAARKLLGTVPTCRKYSMKELEILNDAAGAPFVHLPGGSNLPGSLSLSHSSHKAFCAYTPGPGLHLGIDLEKVEPRSNAFVSDYFTGSEQALVSSAPMDLRALAANLVWSMKESMLKALGVGLHWDTRRVEILGIESLQSRDLPAKEWGRMQVADRQLPRRWSAWWQRREEFVLTMAAYSSTDSRVEAGSVNIIETRLP